MLKEDWRFYKVIDFLYNSQVGDEHADKKVKPWEVFPDLKVIEEAAKVVKQTSQAVTARQVSNRIKTQFNAVPKR